MNRRHAVFVIAAAVALFAGVVPIGSAARLPTATSTVARDTPTAEQLAVADRLDAHVRFRGDTPRSIIGVDGAPLAPASPDARSTALGFVHDHGGLFGFGPADLAGLRVSSDTATTPLGARTIVLEQTDAGRVVDGAVIVFTFDRDGALRAVSANVFPNAQADAARPAFPAAVALESVARLHGGSAVAFAPLDRRGDVLRFANGDLAPATVRLVTHPDRDGEARLGWLVTVEIDDATAMRSIVDAVTGEILAERNLVADDGPRGNVFTEQHPQIPGASQTTVDFTGVNGSWVDGDTTAGNNAIAYEDTEGDNTSGDGNSYMPTDADAHFDYTYTDAINTSGGTDRTTDEDAVITQAFYYVNMLHDVYYGLGFTEATRNFQDDNFGNGGADGDRVLVEVDDQFDNAAVGCNANMFTPADGGSPRLQLFVGRASCSNRDMHRAMNGDTVTHEFGHGVSNRLVGGGNLGSGSQTGALGEGWSDALANARWNDPIYGEYNNDNYTTGIRSVAYDTSALTYGNFAPSNGVHSNGRIWATAMWDARETLVSRYGDGAGRHEQHLISGMLATPTDPDFLDARDGYLAANVSEYGAADWCPLWVDFAEVGMGSDASSSADQNTETTGDDVPAECKPTADAGGPYSTPEGTDVTVDASGSSTSTHPSGGANSYAWDLDDDGDFDDATGPTATFDMVGDDAVHTVSVQVTNEAGVSDTDSTTVTVTNVAPTVTLDLDATGDESASISLDIEATDPGWLDPLTATVDWGDGVVEPVSGTVENVRPDASLTASATHHYGDNGTFTVEVCVSDDDTTTCETAMTTISNVDPTAVIDLSGTTTWNGQQVFLAHAGESVALPGNTTDPGSDDLDTTWDFGDGSTETQTSLVNPPDPDPLPSPTVQPRDVDHDTTHEYAEACVYEVGFDSLDDDGGTAEDSATVVIQGNESKARSAGWWHNQAKAGQRNKNDLTDDEMTCRLAIVSVMSSVFDEVHDVSSFSAAAAALHDDGHDPSKVGALDRALLTAWLNFANGAFDLDSPIDPVANDGSGEPLPAATFAEQIERAETLRHDASATAKQRNSMASALKRLG